MQVFPLLFNQHRFFAWSVQGHDGWRFVVHNKPNKSRSFISIDRTIRCIIEVSKQTVGPVSEWGGHAAGKRTVDDLNLNLILAKGQLDLKALGGGIARPEPDKVARNVKRSPGLNPETSRSGVFV